MKRHHVLAVGGICAVLAAPVLLQQIDLSSSVAVTAAAVKPRIVRDSVTASGSLTYEREARLSPEVIGRVTAVLVKEGDHVDPGQVIVRIDDAPYRAAVAQQQAALLEQTEMVERQRLTVADARHKVARVEKLEQAGFISRSNADERRLEQGLAETDLQRNILDIARARAVLSQASQELKRTIIRAPMAGSVITVSIKPGETAVPSAIGIPGSSLVTIADRDTIVADLDVDESDISHLQIGQPASIYCPPLPGVSLNGVIRSIALGLRPGGMGQRDGAGARNYSVKVGFTDSRVAGLRPGMECRATIFTSPASPELAVPVQAVRSSRADDIDGYTAPAKAAPGRKTDFVFVLDGGRAYKRFVKLGRADSTFQQVLSGLSARDQVIVGPYRMLQLLVDGQRVRAQAASDGAGS